jgi:hypothetical protein
MDVLLVDDNEGDAGLSTTINQSNIRRLHECIDRNDLENAFVVSTCHMLTVLRRGKCGLSGHFFA